MSKRVVISICPEKIEDVVYKNTLDSIVNEQFSAHEKYVKDTEDIYHYTPEFINECNLSEDEMAKIRILELPDDYSVYPIKDDSRQRGIIIGRDVRYITFHPTNGSLLKEDIEYLEQFIVPFTIKEKE